MKLSRSFILVLAVGLLTIFVVSVAIKVYWDVNHPSVPAPKLSYTLSPSQTSLKVGSKVSVPVYLSGSSATNTTAFDVKFSYDATKLKLTGATAGTFFTKPLTVKWDLNNAWFALAINPTGATTAAELNSPLLTLQFTAIGKSASTVVSTGDSTVYLSKTGGFNPKTGAVDLSIN